MIFIDTGAFISRYITRDQHHKSSVRFWNQIKDSGERLFTSNFVLDETFTLLGRRAGYSFAAKRAKKIYASNRFTILRPAESEEQKAISVFEKYADQEISFTDCVSFVLRGSNRKTGRLLEHHSKGMTIYDFNELQILSTFWEYTQK